MAANPFTPPSVPNSYNVSPPPDDGGASAPNLVQWSKHIDKIGNPLKLFSENIVSAVTAAFGKTVNTDPDEQNILQGSLAFTPSELTIASGAITPTRSSHTVDTEGDASGDDLTDISTASFPDGGRLTLRAVVAGRTVVVRNGTGAGKINLARNQDFFLDDAEKSIELERRGDQWFEIGRSLNFLPTTLHIRSIAAPGGGGGAPALNQWTRSILNDFVSNGIPGASLDPASVIVLPAGVYHMSGYRSFYRTLQSRARLYNLTDNGTLVIGMPGVATNLGAPENQAHTPLQGAFTLNAPKAIDLQYLVRGVGPGQEGFGLGFPANDGLPEIYADLMFHKIG